MGADIYIQSISRRAREQYQAPFDAALQQRDAAERSSAAYDAAQAEVDRCYHLLCDHDGYFRDSYNNSSLFARLNLSWWQDVGDLLDAYPEGPQYVEDGDNSAWEDYDGPNLSVEGVRRLRDLVVTATLTLPDPATLRREYAAVAPKCAALQKQNPREARLFYGDFLTEYPDAETYVTKQHQYYLEKYARFLAFLDRALALNEGLRCSI